MENTQQKIITISGPSGVGKNTLLDYVRSVNPRLDFAVSATSRDIRPGEQEGKNYFYLSPSEFRTKIDAGEFLEYFENYPGKFYGTLWSEIHRIWDEGKIFISDIDVMGALNIKKKLGSQVLTIFIIPPSLSELEKRLIARGTETKETLAPRMSRWKMELEKRDEFDVVIMNDNLASAQKEIVATIDNFIAE